MPAAVTVLVGVAAVLGVGGWVVRAYNDLVGLRGLVEEAWRQLEKELSCRRELIPDLIRAARSSAPGTVAAVDSVLRAHAATVAAAARPAGRCGRPRLRWASPPAGLVDAERALSAQLNGLLGLAPGDLRGADAEDFVALHQELRATQRRIAAGRRYFNAAAAALNARVSRFPPRLIAVVTGIRPMAPFHPLSEPVPDGPSTSSPQPAPPRG